MQAFRFFTLCITCIRFGTQKDSHLGFLSVSYRGVCQNIVPTNRKSISGTMSLGETKRGSVGKFGTQLVHARRSAESQVALAFLGWRSIAPNVDARA